MDNIEKVMRARVLRRCRRPALASMEYSMIYDELYEISSACTDIHYFVDGDRTLLDALVETGVLRNDGWSEIEGFTDNFALDPKNPRVEVTIEEMEGVKRNGKRKN